MRRLVNWIWSHGILSTFLTGLFAILPLVLTVAIVVWVVGFIQGIVGPGTVIGGQIERLGGASPDGAAATFVEYLFGWVIVLAGIWAFGLLLRTTLKSRIEGVFNAVIERIPIINSVYSTANQLVGMVRKSDNSELSSMSAVYCTFGRPEGTGLLALMTSPDVYHFAGPQLPPRLSPHLPGAHDRRHPFRARRRLPPHRHDRRRSHAGLLLPRHPRGAGCSPGQQGSNGAAGGGEEDQAPVV